MDLQRMQRVADSCLAAYSKQRKWDLTRITLHASRSAVFELGKSSPRTFGTHETQLGSHAVGRAAAHVGSRADVDPLPQTHLHPKG